MNIKSLELANSLKTQIEKINELITKLETPKIGTNDYISFYYTHENGNATSVNIYKFSDALRGLGEPLNYEIQDIINENRERILIRLKRRLKVLEEEFDSI